MPKPALPQVQFKHGDETYTLKFSMRAIGALQRLWQLENFDQVQDRLNKLKDGNINDMCDVMWAGLQSYHRQLSRDDVMDILDDMGPDVETVLGEALTAATPDVETEKKTVAA